MQKDKKTARIAADSAFVVLALALSYLESFVPTFLPGARLGLTNIALTVCAYKFSVWDSFAVSLCRILISYLLFGNSLSLAFSLCGGAMSLLTLAFLKRHSMGLSLIGVSVFCAFSHNVGQLVMACLLVGGAALSYALYLVPASLVFGALNGVIMTRIPDKIFK